MQGAIVTKKKQQHLRVALLIAACALASQATATELVYYPLNPSFGGSPLNGPVLLNSAIATNRHTDPDIGSDRFGIEEKTPAQLLNDSIERNIIGRLTSVASSQIMDANGNFIPGGILQTSNFVITVSDTANIDGKFTVTTTDKLTGAVTTFLVSNS